MSVVSKKFSASLYSMLVLLLLCLVTAFSSGCGNKASLDPAKPVTLTIWHVYGNQTNSPFNDTIEKFNASEGKAKGVIVKVASVSSSNVIDKALFASAKQEPGAVPLPDLFTAYPRVIPAMHDKLLHWDKYLDKEDLAVYQPEFLAEGYQDKELLMLPVAKSTETRHILTALLRQQVPAPRILPIMTSFLSSAASIIPGPAAKTCASWMISITIT